MIYAMCFTMLVAMVLVFLAYREGIKTGLSMQNGKVPAITPTEKKVEMNEFERAVKAEERALKEQDTIISDIEEALNFNNLYKVGDVNES